MQAVIDPGFEVVEDRAGQGVTVDDSSGSLAQGSGVWGQLVWQTIAVQADADYQNWGVLGVGADFDEDAGGLLAVD